MQNKVRVHITEVNVNAPTYTNVTFNPSMINFFYGKNGTGKSTLAKAFKDGNADLTWDGAPYPEERILVYNEDFISKNVQSYGNIPGVFTISEVNAEKKKMADAKTEAKKDADYQANVAHIAADKITADHEKAEEAYIKAIWDKTETIRKKYPATQAGFMKDKKKFANQLANAPLLVSTDEECSSLYNTVFGKQQPRYNKYSNISVGQVSPLMEQPIISRANTEFAMFIRALGNMDWVSAGHKAYHGKTDGKCPYCQGTLPADFENQLAACYDEQYKDDLNTLIRFMGNYQNDMLQVKQAVESNLQNPFPTKLLGDYKKQAQLLLAAISRNGDLLQRKKDNPSEVVTLEDLTALSDDLNAIITSINDEVDAYMAVLADIPGQQQKCAEMVWGMMANDCKDDIQGWLKRTEDDRNMWKARADEEKSLRKISAELDDEIAKLNSETVNTTKAMQDINRLIASAGFKGFELREKPGAKYVYELVRDINGQMVVVDKNLSEGERHFIAFLYFYHMVMGSQSDDGKQVDKIVVIDDPVSSMDSSSLFVVASLTREMIAVCYNNYDMSEENRDDHIRQFFCMTHNPYFFREISFNRLSDYECASFFEIKKNGDNQTSITECVDNGSFVGDGKINRSPVKNTYDALWDEYMHTDSPDTLMIVIRQILEYYFIQMVGYQNADLRKDLLNKKDFSKEDYAAASAMIAMINVGATGFNDGLYYDSSAADLTHLRSVFEKIFIAMGQEQHYNMMTRRI